MTQTVHHRTAPYSRAQMRWAHAAEARGQIAPEHVRVWEQRAKRRDLPEYAGIGQPMIEYTQSEPGFPHAKATVAKMGELIREFSTAYPIRHLATEITRNIPSKSATRELYAIYQWVRKNIRYRKDPRTIEWLQTPCRTLKEGAGDCDCLATLIGALAESLGHPTRLVTVGPTKLLPKHVAVEAYDGKRWITLDPVIEESGDTGVSEPGKFGMQARGARTTWDTRGNMIGAFGAEPTAIASPNTKIYDLWEANAFKLGSLGYEMPGERQIWAVEQGAIPGYTAIGYLGDMGFSLKKIGKAIGKVAKGAVRVVKKVAGTAGKVAKIAAPIVTMLPIPGAQAMGPAIAQGGQIATQVSRALPAFKKKKSAASRVVLSPRGAATAMSRLFGKRRAVSTRPLAVSARTSPIRARVPSAGGLVDVLPMLAASFADLMNMYKASAGLSGIKPMLSFTFSGIEETKVLAQKAVDRVQRFIDKVGQPPQIKLAEVRAFQAADAADKRKGALSIDGIWGPNAATAARWYTGKDVPDVAKPYKKYKVTWVKPTAAKALPVVEKPVAVKETPPIPMAVPPPKMPKEPMIITRPPLPGPAKIIKPPADGGVIDAGPAFPKTIIPEPLKAIKPIPPKKKKPVVVAIKPAKPEVEKTPPTPVKLTPIAKTTPPVVSVEPQPVGPAIVPIQKPQVADIIPLPKIPLVPRSSITADQMPPLKVPVTKTVPPIPTKPLAVPIVTGKKVPIPKPPTDIEPIPKITEEEKKTGANWFFWLAVFYLATRKKRYYR